MQSNYHKVPYIDHDIQCTEKIPENLRALIEMLKQCDKENPILYFDYMDAFVVNVKNAYAARVISKTAYDALNEKYFIHALRISKMEDE